MIDSYVEGLTMMRRLTIPWMFLMVFGSMVATVQAQTAPPIDPGQLLFAHSNADLALTATYHVDFFQCASVNPATGVCVGQAAAPFQTGADVPRASVATLTPPDAQGRNRSINLKTAPSNGVLASMPAGVAFVGALIAIGDPAAGGTGPSARSVVSNPFFAKGLSPATPSALAVQ